jgi:hypothetical protein
MNALKNAYLYFLKLQIFMARFTLIRCILLNLVTLSDESGVYSNCISTSLMRGKSRKFFGTWHALLLCFVPFHRILFYFSLRSCTRFVVILPCFTWKLWSIR